MDAARAVFALLSEGGMRRDLRLRDQISACAEQVASAISEGFEQSTDRHFAQYLYRARGSGREIRTQLTIAADRRHISHDDCERVCAMYDEIARMLTGLIVHLEREDRKHRR